MLIKCPNCGAPFDIEKRGSVCPQCKTDTAKIKREKTDKEKRSFWVQLVGSLIIIFIMIAIFVHSRMYIASEKEQYEAAKGILDVEVMEPGMGILIDSHPVNITGCEVIEGLEEYLPEGYSFLAVSYEANSSGYFSELDSEVYLILSTGEYQSPLEKELVLDVLQSAGMNGSDVTEYLMDGKRRMIFMVSNQTKSATLAVYDMNTIRWERNSNYADDFTAVFHIPLEWEVTG